MIKDLTVIKERAIEYIMNTPNVTTLSFIKAWEPLGIRLLNELIESQRVLEIEDNRIGLLLDA